MDVLNLRGVLTLDKSQYDKGLADADTGAHSFGGRFSKAMKVGAVALAAHGAATAVAGKKLVSGAMDVAKYGDHVDKMSQKIGISAEAYQKWDYVMQRAGGNVDQLKMGMKTLSQQAEKNSKMKSRKKNRMKILKNKRKKTRKNTRETKRKKKK